MDSRLRVALTPGDFVGETRKFARAHGDGVMLGRLVKVSAAEVALFPFNAAICVETEGDRRRLIGIVEGNARQGLRTVLYVGHDTSNPIDLGQPDAVVLRPSMLRSVVYANDHATPVTVDDLWANRQWRAVEWADLPMVGFMGQVDAEIMRAAVRGARSVDVAVPAGHTRRLPDAGQPVFPSPIGIGGILRRRAIAGLAGSELVHASVVVRDRFHGHQDAAQQALFRSEFVAHLLATPYNLCIRGSGNYSIRLFETMAAGRIPVLLETDLVLPCADVIDWDAIAVRVPLADIDRIDEHVAAAHRAAGPSGFVERQRASRRAWEDYLSLPAFSRYVADVVLAGERRD